MLCYKSPSFISFSGGITSKMASNPLFSKKMQQLFSNLAQGALIASHQSGNCLWFEDENNPVMALMQSSPALLTVMFPNEYSLLKKSQAPFISQ